MASIEVPNSIGRPAPLSAGPSLQRVGGLAALLEGVAIIAFTVLFVVVQPALGFKDSDWDDPSRAVPFVAAHQGYFIGASLFLIVASLIVLPVAVALHDRLRARAPGLVITATLFGVIGVAMLLLNGLVQYAEFRAMGELSATIAGQVEPYGNVAFAATNGAAALCLGLWTLLLSVAIIQRGGLPRWLGYFGLLVGVASPLALFGPPIGQLLSIIWFIAVGGILLRAPSPVVPSASQAA